MEIGSKIVSFQGVVALVSTCSEDPSSKVGFGKARVGVTKDDFNAKRPLIDKSPVNASAEGPGGWVILKNSF